MKHVDNPLSEVGNSLPYFDILLSEVGNKYRKLALAVELRHCICSQHRIKKYQNKVMDYQLRIKDYQLRIKDY